MDLWTGFEDAFVLAVKLWLLYLAYSNQVLCLTSGLRALLPLLHIHAFDNHPQA